MTALIVPLEKWMDLRRYRPLRAAGATYREIAAEAGVDWRTARKYLAVDAAGAPSAAPPPGGDAVPEGGRGRPGDRPLVVRCPDVAGDRDL